jgi:hypothetical protein
MLKWSKACVQVYNIAFVSDRQEFEISPISLLSQTESVSCYIRRKLVNNIEGAITFFAYVPKLRLVFSSALPTS